MSRLRIGVVGAGNIATTVHLPAYTRLRDRVELVAICDTDLGRAGKAGAAHGIPGVYASWEEMLAAGGLDGVSICVANNLHCPVTLAALGAGLHVLCEKPPALDAREARAMEAGAAASGKVLAYGLHWRFSPELRAAKALAEAGDLGRIYSGRVRALRRRGIPGWGSFTDKAVQGGGALIDIGVHMLDAALHIMGYPEPAWVLASAFAEIGTRPGPGLMGAWDPDRFGVEDSLFGSIRFADGSLVQVETAFALNMGPKSVMGVELYGSRAGLDLLPLEVHGERAGELCDIKFPFFQETDAHFACIEDFVMACLENREARTGAREGRILQDLLGLLYRSAELGQPVAAGALA